MKIVAGLSLVNLKPQVWDTTLPYHLPELHTVMISYADFHQSPTRRHRAIEEGLHTSLDIQSMCKFTWIMVHSDFHEPEARSHVRITKHSWSRHNLIGMQFLKTTFLRRV